MPRWVFLWGVGAALVTLALAVTDHALTPPPGVTDANLSRIQKGMTLPEVERILGGPPAAVGYGSATGFGREWTMRDWRGPGWDASVWFGTDGRVGWVFRWNPTGGFGVEVEPSGPLAPLRSLVGW